MKYIIFGIFLGNIFITKDNNQIPFLITILKNVNFQVNSSQTHFVFYFYLFIYLVVF